MSRRSGEGIRSPGAGITDSCGPNVVVLGTDPEIPGRAARTFKH